MEIRDTRRVDPNLLLEFFLTFARFEYALKATGFFVRPRNDRPHVVHEAKPAWDRFAVSLRNVFLTDVNADVAEACRFLSESPPDKQVIINEQPGWETQARKPADSEIEFLLRMIRCVRNNLFHGAKHNLEIHATRDRTEKLLLSSLVILKNCLALKPDQKRAYDEATL